MSFSIGDTVFDKKGRPGTVIGRDEKAQLVVDQKDDAYQKARRRGFVNGLKDDQRVKFNEVIDQVLEKETTRERVDQLQEKIDELRTDPRNHAVTRYLEGEMLHMMNSEGLHPRSYKVQELSVRE